MRVKQLDYNFQTFEIVKNEDSASEAEDMLDGMQRLMILGVGVMMVLFSLLIPLLVQQEKGEGPVVG